MQEHKDRDVQPVNLSRTRSVIAYKVARLWRTRVRKPGLDGQPDDRDRARTNESVFAWAWLQKSRPSIRNRSGHYRAILNETP